MAVKLTEAELVIMEILWREGPLRASEVADKAKAEKGWEKNTTYTLLSRLVKKGALRREDPGFVCYPVLGEKELRRTQAKSLLDRMYGGSISLFVRAFLDEQKVSEEELEELRKLIDGQRR